VGVLSVFINEPRRDSPSLAPRTYAIAFNDHLSALLCISGQSG